MLKFGAKVTGGKETVSNLNKVNRDLSGSPYQQAMRDATLLVTRDAKRYAPVDRGQLRASITPEVRTQGKTIMGVVGSNKVYAAAQELGTRPFWPPLAPLLAWARRKVGPAGAWGLAVAVQRTIAARGIKAKRYLQRAIETNADKIVRKLSDAVGRIVR